MDDLFSPMLSAGRNVLVRGVRAPFDASMKDFGRKDVRPDFA
jgi:hypothetical protein